MAEDDLGDFFAEIDSLKAPAASSGAPGPPGEGPAEGDAPAAPAAKRARREPVVEVVAAAAAPTAVRGGRAQAHDSRELVEEYQRGLEAAAVLKAAGAAPRQAAPRSYIEAADLARQQQRAEELRRVASLQQSLSAAPAPAPAPAVTAAGVAAGAAAEPAAAEPAAEPAGAPVVATMNKRRGVVRHAGGQTWVDEQLVDWPTDDFRLYVTDLDNTVNDDTLARAFSTRYPSFNKARVVRDKSNNKSKGYGFLSFGDPYECAAAMREMQGKYLGNRTIKLQRSTWQERNKGRVGKKRSKRHMY